MTDIIEINGKVYFKNPVSKRLVLMDSNSHRLLYNGSLKIGEIPIYPYRKEKKIKKSRGVGPRMSYPLGENRCNMKMNSSARMQIACNFKRFLQLPLALTSSAPSIQMFIDQPTLDDALHEVFSVLLDRGAKVQGKRCILWITARCVRVHNDPRNCGTCTRF